MIKTIIITIIISTLATMGFLYVVDSYADDYSFESYDIGCLPDCRTHLCILYGSKLYVWEKDVKKE